jgi:PAS domain S-box-containing protein
MNPPTPLAHSTLLHRVAAVNWPQVFCVFAYLHLVMIVVNVPEITAWLSSRGFLIYNLVFALVLLRVAVLHPQHPWLVQCCRELGTSFVLVATGSSLRLLQTPADPIVFAMDWSAIPYLASYIYLARGIITLSQGLLPEVTWRGNTQDRIILAVGAAILIWYLAAEPLIHVQAGPLDRLLNVAYPIGVLATMMCMIPLLLKVALPDVPRGLKLLVAGFAAYLACDLYYQIIPSMRGTFLGLQPFAWGDIAYLLSYLLLVSGAEGVARDSRQLSSATPRQVESAKAASALALFTMGAVYFVLWRAALTGNWNDMTGIAIAWAVITVLVVIHGVISLRANQRLIEAQVNRAAEERVWEAMRNVHVGVLLFGPNADLLMCNPAACNLLGFDFATLAARSSVEWHWKALHEDGSWFAREELPVERALVSGLPQRNVAMGIERGGDRDRIWLLVNAEPQTNGDGKVGQVLCTMVDISDRIRLEAQLRESQRMESIGQLAAGIAHDFNNLLTVIMGSAELLRESLTGNDQYLESVNDILNSSERAASLTAQFLAFGRRQMLKSEVLDINDVLTRTEKLLRRTLGEDVDVRLNLAPRPVHILADQSQMEQVIVNLSINARDAMPHGGTLEISTRRKRNAVGTDIVAMSFRDTGQGMDDATKQRIFEPFFTTKAVGKGSGLGLAVVYGILKQSGGEIEVQSTPGAGTTFTLFMPLTQKAEQKKSQDAQPPPPAINGSGTVMVVEDEASVRGIVRGVLKTAGYNVIEAGTGAEGLRLAREHRDRIDILVSDVIMPGCSGPQLAQQCRQRWPDLPVLFLSGYGDEKVGPTGLSDFNTSFLQKPFTHAALCAKLQELTHNMPCNAEETS